MNVEKEVELLANLQEKLSNRRKTANAGQGRVFAGEILTGGLLHILDETKGKFDRLRRRILDERPNDLRNYAIRMTIVDRCAYDPTNLAWFPVRDADLRPYLLDEETLWAAIDCGEPAVIRHVFLQASDEACRNILQRAQTLTGFLQTDRGEIPALFRLVESRAYRNEALDLYRLFYANKIPWTTLNTAYLDKFFAVRLERLQGVIPNGARWRGVRLDYGSYRSIIDEARIPLWNLRRLRRNADVFPMPCIDGVNYEHVLELDGQSEKSGWLVASAADIADIRCERGQGDGSIRLVAVSAERSDAPWELREIITSDAPQSLGYDQPSLSNAFNNENAVRAVCAQPRTKEDLRRILDSLGIAKWLRFTDCKFLCPQMFRANQESMDWFIKEELYDQKNENVLRLSFVALQPGYYLNDAMTRFAASFLQRLIPEYRCVGVIEEENAPRGMRQTEGE